MLGTYPEVVHYFLQTYVTAGVIADTDATLMRFTQRVGCVSNAVSKSPGSQAA